MDSVFWRNTLRSLLIVAASATLLIPNASSAMKPWIAISAGLGTYAMSDVNEDIEATNAMIAPYSMDEVTNGMTLGVQAGVDVSPMFTTSMGFDRLFATTNVGDATGELEYRLPANAYRATLEYRVPTASPTSFGIGVGAGLVQAAGDISMSVSGVGAASADVSGYGPLVEAFLVADVWANKYFAISPSVGYRYAKVGSFKMDGATTYNADGSKMSIDYSGVSARLAVKVGLK
jgi:hypothetical protein